MIRFLCLVVFLLSFPVTAAIDAYPFPNPKLQQRHHALIAELRCPQCLNTNLAGSDSMIARDLRREVHRMLLEGMSDEEILDFMYQRYGDFILYKPRLQQGTLLLWFGPLVLLLIAMIIAWRLLKSGKADPANLSDSEAERLKALLKRE